MVNRIFEMIENLTMFLQKIFLINKKNAGQILSLDSDVKYLHIYNFLYGLVIGKNVVEQSINFYSKLVVR